METMYVWLLVGVLFLFIEAFGIPGIGMMFAGFGALLVGVVISFGAVSPDATVWQFIVFFAGTAVFALLLWKPMQKFRVGRGSSGYNNIVGETAYVGSQGLTKRDGGEVTWSGTIMKARLAPDAPVEKLDAGSQVTIVDMSGVTLIVTSK